LRKQSLFRLQGFDVLGSQFQVPGRELVEERTCQG
jgi:hypothetical protein